MRYDKNCTFFATSITFDLWDPCQWESIFSNIIDPDLPFADLKTDFPPTLYYKLYIQKFDYLDFVTKKSTPNFQKPNSILVFGPAFSQYGQKWSSVKNVDLKIAFFLLIYLSNQKFKITQKP